MLIPPNIEQKLQDIWTVIQQRQAAFITNHGRYFQGLVTHTVTPQDGAETTGDRLNTHPHYQPETWAQVFPQLPALPLPISVTVDQYETPAGELGYVATVRANLGGQEWARAQQLGPESWRQYGWTQVTLPSG